MKAGRRHPLACLGVVLLVAVAGAQEGGRGQPTGRWIEVHVSGIAADSLYLDAGHEAGLRAGDRVRLHPAGRARLEAIVRDVARSSARAELDPPGGELPQVGTRGELFVPADRLVADTTDDADGPEQTRAAPAPARPQHPPWTRGPEEWDDSLPLLAPVAARRAEERPTTWHGRLWVGGEWIDDRANGAREYESLRAGLDLELANPLEGAGRLALDAEWYRRVADTEVDDEEETTRLRIDRFSYAAGGVRGHPQRWEFGRFLSSEFPELGVVDGIELVHRQPSGSRWGASAGLLPDWDDAMETGEDVQGALFWRWVDDQDERLAFGAAAQKTWHEGERDRDLMILTGDWRPEAGSAVHGSAWVDWYGSHDRFEEEGFDLTRLVLSGTRRLGAGAGLGAYLTHFRYPEQLADELEPSVAASLAELEVTRLSLSGWMELSPSVRLSARADRWQDQEASGGGAELEISTRDFPWRDGELSVALSDFEGRFSSGPGLRVSASRRLAAGWMRVGYDTTTWEQPDFVGEQRSLRHDGLSASWDTRLGAELDLSLWVGRRFGDEQDSTTVGFVLQRRF